MKPGRLSLNGVPFPPTVVFFFSFQKNHLIVTFYPTYICLFMCPSTRAILREAILIVNALGKRDWRREEKGFHENCIRVWGEG